MATMTESDLVNVRTVLEAYGQSTVALMREALTETRQRRRGNGQLRALRTNAVATGELERSLAYQVTWNGSSFEVDFTMVDYGVYVDRGRRPGKQPPIGPIKEWARVRGLPESIAFPVARTIGREGIAARPFFGSSVDEGTDQLVQRLAEAYALDVEAWLARQTAP